MHRRTLLKTLGAVAALGPSLSVPARTADRRVVWPHGAKAAVSLTYDDGMMSHLDAVIPDLEQAGLHGTFYLQTSKDIVVQNVARWREAFADGHEIGNHTANHPCPADMARPLDRTPESMAESEIRPAVEFLDTAIGKDPFRTFAYPCGVYRLAGDEKLPDAQSGYLRVLRDAAYAARITGYGIVDPATVNSPVGRYRIGSLSYDGHPVTTFIDEIEKAERQGFWAVFCFHGIGPETRENYLAASRETHRGLLHWLQNRQDRFWVRPLRDVARFIRGELPPGA